MGVLVAPAVYLVLAAVLAEVEGFYGGFVTVGHRVLVCPLELDALTAVHVEGIGHLHGHAAVGKGGFFQHLLAEGVQRVTVITETHHIGDFLTGRTLGTGIEHAEQVGDAEGRHDGALLRLTVHHFTEKPAAEGVVLRHILLLLVGELYLLVLGYHVGGVTGPVVGVAFQYTATGGAQHEGGHDRCEEDAMLFHGACFLGVLSALFLYNVFGARILFAGKKNSATVCAVAEFSYGLAIERTNLSYCRGRTLVE